MDAARQVLRFSIPGSVLVLEALLLLTVVRAIQGVPAFATLVMLKDSVAPLAGVLATIPIGFLIYQFYYVTYAPIFRPTPWRWNGRWVRLDRGAEILRDLPESQPVALNKLFDIELDITLAHRTVASHGPWHPLLWVEHKLKMLELTSEWCEPIEVKPDPATSRFGRWRAKRRARRERARKLRTAYEKRWHENWNVLRSVVNIASGRSETAHVEREYTTLSDIYHALGASRTAAWMGLIAVLALVGGRPQLVGDEPWRTAIGTGVAVVLTLVLAVVLHLTRRKTWRSAAASLQFGLGWLLSTDPRLFARDVDDEQVMAEILHPRRRDRTLVRWKDRVNRVAHAIRRTRD